MYADGFPAAPVPPVGAEQDLWFGLWAGQTGGEDVDETRIYRGALDGASIAALAAVNPG